LKPSKGKLPVFKGEKVERSISVNGQAKAVIATENPIPRWDEKTQQVVAEVLLMDGIVWRGGRDQIPIVDSHNDKTVRNIFGSIQNMQVDQSTGELIGVPVFASDSESQTIAQRMYEGHITDFSITGQPIETIYVARGQSYTTSRGAVIDGPALIHTQWQPQNASICATGADEQSTVRRSYTDLNRKVMRMDEALLSQLSALGLPEGMTDPNQVMAWVIGKLPKEEPEVEMVENAAPAAEPTVEAPAAETQSPVENMATPPAEQPVARQADPVEAIKRALEQDKARRKEIQATCTLAKIERAFADELCDSLTPLSDARKRIIERMATTPLGASVGADVRVIASEHDKYFAAAEHGLLKRSFAAGKLNRKPYEQEAPGAKDFENARVRDIARELVERMGVNTRNISRTEILKIALGDPSTMRRHRVERNSPAYHTTGSFQNLLLDVSNKTLLAAYNEAPSTWQMWARQAESVEDFKPIYRVRISEMADLEQIPEGQKYPESALSDKKESYKVEKYGATTTVTWETFVNDDMNALSQIPVHQGRSARRTQNRAVYSVLTANANLADGGALFNSTAQSSTGGHANLAGSGSAVSSTSMNTAYTSMLTKYGLASDAILSIMPRFIIFPAGISGTVLEFLSSISPPTVGGSAVGTSGTNNIYGPNGDRPLTPVCEPMLDANSSTSWYLASNSGDCDTVELAFLQGEESPVIESEFDFDRDVYKHKVRQTFGVAAIDFRGLYKNPGA
jgi:hypothetical protein